MFAVFGENATLVLKPHTTVVAGNPVEIWCQLPDLQPIDNCYISVPGLGRIKIYSTYKDDESTPIGSLKNGTCGLRLHSVRRHNTGSIKCELEYVALHSVKIANTNLEVLSPFERLRISCPNSYCEFYENEEIRIKISAPGGNPPANVSCSLGLGESNNKFLNLIKILKPGGKDVSLTEDGENFVWSAKAQVELNGQQLNCLANQQPFNKPETAEKLLRIFCETNCF